MKKQLPIPTSHPLAIYLASLHKQRKAAKQKRPRNTKLTKKQRQLVLDKTGGKCHICGIALEVNNFQADHVQSHTTGGSSTIDNFLPSCSTCNNYRWHYLPEEIQMILKLGVWTKTQIERETKLGEAITESFMKYEARRERANINRKK